MNPRTLTAATLLTATTLTACGEPTPEPLPTVTITYEGEHHAAGTNTGIADITYITPTGIRQQGVDLPITPNGSTHTGYPIPGFTPGDPVGLTLQNDTTPAGRITCRIRASDGAILAENTSSGPHAVVSCNANAR